MNRTLDVATSWTISALRYPVGYSVANVGARPAQPLVLYEFEGCPFCRKVREALTMLDLDAEIRPCPKGGQRFRGEVMAKGGKRQFPYLVDPNTGASMYESDDIISYLYTQYGTKRPFAVHWTAPGNVLTSMFAGPLRGGLGVRARKSRAPGQLLELYNMEISPYCRIVREVLCELELPYLVHNVGHDSGNRSAFIALSGKQMVPYLVDPNTRTQMFESADIKAYLNRTYAI
jgi:glutathione S-transferase